MGNKQSRPSQINESLINELTSKLNSRLVLEDGRLPNLFHLVWIGNQELPYLAELSIRSIHNHNQNYQIVLHYTNPELFNSLRIKTLMNECNLQCNLVNNITYIHNVKIDRVTAQSDIIRLLVVYLYGGMYIDTDMIVIKNVTPLFDKLRDSNRDLLVGEEVKTETSVKINNGMILGIKNSSIIKLWLSLIPKTYNKGGWSEHGVLLISKIYPKNSSKIFLYSSKYFNPIDWRNIESVLSSNCKIDLDTSYIVHLFNSSCKSILRELESNHKYVKEKSNNLTSIISLGLGGIIGMDMYESNIKLPEVTFDLNSIHFVIDKSLSNMNILCLKSMMYHNPSTRLVVHTTNPDIQIENVTINVYETTNVIHLDKIRLYILYKYGGMLMDLDMICLQSLTSCFDIFNEQNRNNGKTIMVCKELNNEKGYYVNDGMILSISYNKIIENVLRDDFNVCKKLTNIYLNKESEFILLPYLCFNPLSYTSICQTLVNEPDLQLIQSSFCVNLFSKTSCYMFDEYEKYTFLKYIIDLGLGKIPFYSIDPFNERVHYINLYKRPERNVFFIATWNRVFKNLNRFDAILTNGMINGCGKSHHTIVSNSTDSYTIVLEDDAVLNSHFIETFPKVLNYIKSNTDKFDLFTFSTPTILNPKTKNLTCTLIDDNIVQIGNCSSSHFIIYTPSILKYFDLFYSELSSGKIQETNHDWYFNNQSNVKKMTSYPFLTDQFFGFYSDVVNTEREQGFFNSGAKQLEIIYQALKKGFKGNMFNLIPKKFITI